VFGVVLGAMALATLCNPSAGDSSLDSRSDQPEIGKDISSNGRARIFLSGGVPMKTFERLVLLLVVLLACRRRTISWIDCALLLVFLDQGPALGATHEPVRDRPPPRSSHGS